MQIFWSQKKRKPRILSSSGPGPCGREKLNHYILYYVVSDLHPTENTISAAHCCRLWVHTCSARVVSLLGSHPSGKDPTYFLLPPTPYPVNGGAVNIYWISKWIKIQARNSPAIAAVSGWFRQFSALSTCLCSQFPAFGLSVDIWYPEVFLLADAFCHSLTNERQQG